MLLIIYIVLISKKEGILKQLENQAFSKECNSKMVAKLKNDYQFFRNLNNKRILCKYLNKWFSNCQPLRKVFH